jgi:hypothetical protein
VCVCVCVCVCVFVCVCVCVCVCQRHIRGSDGDEGRELVKTLAQKVHVVSPARCCCMLLLPRCCRLASPAPPSLLPQTARRVTARRVAANTFCLQIRNAQRQWVARVTVCARRAAKYVSACLRTYETTALEEAVGHLIQGTESGQQRARLPLLRVRGIPETEFRLRRSSQTGSLVEGRAN